ncbi:MAG: hypothetical protein AAF702_29695 [Chloroflexota bacterium]
MNILSRLLFALRKFWLERRIQSLASGFAISNLSTAEIDERIGPSIRTLEQPIDDLPGAYHTLINLERDAARLESGTLFNDIVPDGANPNLNDAEAKSRLNQYMAGRRLFMRATGVWLLLLLINWISMAGASYNWPVGWFSNDYYLGFAIIGATLNSLFLLLITSGSDQSPGYPPGVYAFRLLQSTIYVAILYQIASLILPESVPECSQRFCLSLQSPLWLVLSFLIGLFVSTIEQGILWFFDTKNRAALSTGLAEHRLLTLSIAIWLILHLSNWLSLISPSYEWPVGWFSNDYYTGFALVGATLNALFFLLRPERSEASRSDPFGVYAFRLLQASVYTAILYHIAGLVLPDTDFACSQPFCISLQNPLLLVISFAIGLLVSPIEKGILWLFDVEGRRRSRNTQFQQLHTRYIKLLEQYQGMISREENPTPPDPMIEGRFRRIRKAIEFSLPQKAATMLLDLELDIFKLAYTSTSDTSAEQEAEIEPAIEPAIEPEHQDVVGEQPEQVETNQPDSVEQSVSAEPAAQVEQVNQELETQVEGQGKRDEEKL